jgi:hypothetical protein
LGVKPTSHAALYNWGVALSDLARCIKATDPKEATAALHLASQKYAQSLQLHPRNPQALNNWGLVLQVCVAVSSVTLHSLHEQTLPCMYNTINTGRHEMLLCLESWSVIMSDPCMQSPALCFVLFDVCVLQELSGDARDWVERDALVHAAMEKFRLTIRSRPDFDRGCYNLGTVFYTFAMALQGDAGRGVASSCLQDATLPLLGVPGQLHHAAWACSIRLLLCLVPC